MTTKKEPLTVKRAYDWVNRSKKRHSSQGCGLSNQPEKVKS